MRRVLDAMPNAVVTLDTKGVITGVNDALLNAAGYRREEIVGKRITGLKIIGAKDLAKIIANFARAVAGANVNPYKVDLKLKSGDVMAVEVDGSPIRKAGKIVGVAANIRPWVENKGKD